MTYSPDALELRKPTTVELPRVSDRISFLHLDRARIWQDRTGVAATTEDGDELRIPVASLSVLLLGPGVSITTPAMTSLHRAGCSILTTSDAGTVGIAAGRPLTSRAHWAEAQARMCADPHHRLEAARALYRARWPDMDWPDDAPLRVMRGVEGAQVKRLYRTLAKKHRLTGWKRETDPERAEDTVNPLLNLANSILYGAALAAVTALGLNPALGVIHQGSAAALLFDLADDHKHRASIPLAFELHSHEAAQQELRRRMRKYLHRTRALEHNLKLLAAILEPHLEPDHGVVLIDDEHGHVAGRINHAERD